MRYLPLLVFVAGCASAGPGPRVRFQPVPDAVLEAADCDPQTLESISTRVRESRYADDGYAVLPAHGSSRCDVYAHLGMPLRTELSPDGAVLTLLYTAESPEDETLRLVLVAREGGFVLERVERVPVRREGSRAGTP